MNSKPSEKQEAVLNFVLDYFTENNKMPTLREIAEEFEFSVSTAIAHLDALQKKGHIAVEPGGHRSIQLKNYRVKLEAVNG